MDKGIKVGSNIRITVGTKQVYAVVTRIYCVEPWDMEYDITDRNYDPGSRGNHGRWKQSIDGGYIQLR